MGLLDIFKKKKERPDPDSEQEELARIIQSNADGLVAQFGKKYPNLDFSVHSL
jgi:hypothetical protein